MCKFLKGQNISKLPYFLKVNFFSKFPSFFEFQNVFKINQTFVCIGLMCIMLGGVMFFFVLGCFKHSAK